MKFKVESVLTNDLQRPHLVQQGLSREEAEAVAESFIKGICEPWDNWSRIAEGWQNGFLHRIHILEE